MTEEGEEKKLNRQRKEKSRDKYHFYNKTCFVFATCSASLS
jgi:hypothetical protein